MVKIKLRKYRVVIFMVTILMTLINEVVIFYGH